MSAVRSIPEAPGDDLQDIARALLLAIGDDPVIRSQISDVVFGALERRDAPRSPELRRAELH